MDKSINYEYLIRKAHNCKEYELIGADRNLYQSLIDSETRYKKSNEVQPMSKISENPAFDYGVKVGLVSAGIREAIAKVINEYDNKLNEIQKEYLEVFIDDLNQSTIEEIDDIIERTNKIFDEIGLKIKE